MKGGTASSLVRRDCIAYDISKNNLNFRNQA